MAAPSAVLRAAWQGAETITLAHLAEALQYRQRESE
jgi:hypothetical protein